MIIAQPTEAKAVQLFEKKLIADFSGVNTKLAFYTNILFPNKESKRQDIKIVYSIRNKGKSKKKKELSLKDLKWMKTINMEMQWQNLSPTVA